MAVFKLLALASIVVALSLAAPSGDLVQNLPGLNFKPNFLHYSGYLNASLTRKLHYWFTRHQYASSSSPVILWLNGGPGCSSVGGLIEELGPFHVSDNGSTVYENPYAWNKVGHVLFLEAPAGVGYSYATDGNTDTNDDQTAKDNHAALVDFFTTKFPELKSNNFYITGESYGGVYIPTLAVLVAADKTNFPNFKGIGIGNGYYSAKLNDDTVPGLYYYHGIVRQNLFDQAIKCCNNQPYGCDYDSMTGNCAQVANELFNQANDLDPYNLYSVCYLDGGSRSKRNTIKKRLTALRTKNPIRRLQRNAVKLGGGLPLCAQDNNTFNYMNRPDVRTALHIPSNLPTWYDCADIRYTENYDDMSTQFKNLIQNKVKILVYNGDVDSVCNIIENERFLQGLNLNYEGGTKQQAWRYNGSFADGDARGDVAGFHVKFTEGVDFVSVRGSGHFVPEDKPREAIQMIYNFINGLPYSTPVPFTTKPVPTISPAEVKANDAAGKFLDNNL